MLEDDRQEDGGRERRWTGLSAEVDDELKERGDTPKKQMAS